MRALAACLVAVGLARSASGADLSAPEVPDVAVRDQDGHALRFYTDLVKDHVVALSFIYTRCPTVCPPLGATIARVEKLLGARAGRDVRLVSISVDPEFDTPERLRAFAERFHGGPGWTLVTATPDDTRRLLRALRASTDRPEDHTPTLLVGNDVTKSWTQTYGLAKPEQIMRVIDDIAGRTAASASSRYFPDVVLVDQDGREVRFYSDVLRGRVVVLNSFFTSCTGVCPPLTASLAHVQKELGPRMGRDILFASITVDPEHDTPARLREYAQRFHVGPGWLFLTGTSAHVEQVLGKLGQWVADPNDHSGIVLIGNDRTGLWKKARALSSPGALLPVVESVLDDTGDHADTTP